MYLGKGRLLALVLGLSAMAGCKKKAVQQKSPQEEQRFTRSEISELTRWHFVRLPLDGVGVKAVELSVSGIAGSQGGRERLIDLSQRSLPPADMVLCFRFSPREGELSYRFTFSLPPEREVQGLTGGFGGWTFLDVDPDAGSCTWLWEPSPQELPDGQFLLGTLGYPLQEGEVDECKAQIIATIKYEGSSRRVDVNSGVEDPSGGRSR